MIKKIFLLFVCLGVSQGLWAVIHLKRELCVGGPYIVEDKCQPDMCDSLGVFYYMGDECCPNRELNKKGASVLKQCPTGYYKSLNGCESCEPEIIDRCAYETGGITDAQICEQCPNRVLNKNGKCVLKHCPDEKMFMGGDGKCRSCDSEGAFYVADEKDCLACPNRQMLNGKCVLKHCPDERPVRGSDGFCHSCESFGPFYAEDEKDCLACPNRVLNKNGECVLKQCPVDEKFLDSYGFCHSCDSLDAIYVADKKDCLVCPNRRMLNENLCVLKQCPDGKPLTGGDGCLACNAPFWREDPKEICDKCPNRFYLEKDEIFGFKLDSSGNRTIIKTKHAGCYLKEHRLGNIWEPLFPVELSRDYLDKRNFDTRPRKSIPDEIILIPKLVEPTYVPVCSHLNQYDCNHLQNFYSCDTKDSISTLPEVCARCPNREYIDGMCIRKYCSDGIEDLDGECHACPTEYNIETTQEECHKCSNRYMAVDDKTGKDVCVSCGVSFDGKITKQECNRCHSNLYGKYLDSQKDACVPLYALNKLETTQEECHRGLATIWGKDLTSGKSICVKYDFANKLETSQEECHRAIGRTVWGKDLENGKDICVKCDFANKLETTQEECNRCPHGKYNFDSNICFLEHNQPLGFMPIPEYLQRKEKSK